MAKLNWQITKFALKYLYFSKKIIKFFDVLVKLLLIIFKFARKFTIFPVFLYSIIKYLSKNFSYNILDCQHIFIDLNCFNLNKIVANLIENWQILQYYNHQIKKIS